MGKICDLLTERLGILLWGRVIEAQPDSGDGWIHWHIVADMAGTRFDLTREKRRPWIDLGSLQEELKDWWCGRWKLGGVGGQDIQRVKKKGAVAGYLCKYVIKNWPAIPEWVLPRKMLRLVGFSKAANALFRKAGMVKPRKKKTKDRDGQGGTTMDKAQQTEPDAKKPIRRREVSPLIVRLPWSGLMCKVISCGEYIGTIKCKESFLMEHIGEISKRFGVYFGSRSWVREYGNGIRSEGSQIAVRMKDATREKVARLNRWLEQQGINEKNEQEAEKRTSDYLMGWEIMQAWRYDC